jgi:hypothetical protein
MIKWIKRKILHWAWSIDEDPIEVGREGRVLDSNAMRIDIYKGVGGIAIETSVYNKTKDANFIGFYIVHDDDKLGEELSKIITVESIKTL